MRKNSGFICCQCFICAYVLFINILSFSAIPYMLSFSVKGCFAYICSWCPGTPEESSTSPGTGTQMLVRCCVGVWIWTQVLYRSNTCTYPSLQFHLVQSLTTWKFKVKSIEFKFCSFWFLMHSFCLPACPACSLPEVCPCYFLVVFINLLVYRLYMYQAPNINYINTTPTPLRIYLLNILVYNVWYLENNFKDSFSFPIATYLTFSLIRCITISIPFHHLVIF